MERSPGQGARAPEQWVLRPYDVGPSELHFQISDTLARNVDRPTVWWHSTETPTLILGATQKPECVDLDHCRRQGALVIRRQAGGAAVFAAPGLLGLDVALPPGHRLSLPDVVEAYRWLGLTWAEALAMLGVEARVVSIAEVRASSIGGPGADITRMACFGSLSPYEVVSHGRKLVGLAQVRRRGRTLFQAGIHRRFDALGLARLLAPGSMAEAARALDQAAIGLEEAAGRSIGEHEIMGAFAAALRIRHGVELISEGR